MNRGRARTTGTGSGNSQTPTSKSQRRRPLVSPTGGRKAVQGLRTLLAAALGAAGCAVPGAAPASVSIAWRLVEAEGETGRRLVLEPDRGTSLRIEVRLSREWAAAGETVEAEIRLPEAEGLHRIEVRPSRPDVTILGPTVFEADGAAPVRVRFTGRAAGKGGIVVLVTE